MQHTSGVCGIPYVEPFVPVLSYALFFVEMAVYTVYVVFDNVIGHFKTIVFNYGASCSVARQTIPEKAFHRQMVQNKAVIVKIDKFVRQIIYSVQIYLS